MNHESRGKPGLTRAREFLLELVSQQKSGVLPPLRRCAQAAEVSLVTLWKAVEELKSEGVLCGKPGRRITFGQPPDLPPQIRISKLLSNQGWRWATVAGELERDIVNRRYEPGRRMPLLKELATRYAASTKTIRKSLSHLVSRSLLVPSHKGFIVRPLTVRTGRHRSRVVLLGYGSRISTGLAHEQGHQEILRKIEARCAQMNVSLEIVLYKRESDGTIRCIEGVSERECRLPDNESVLGYLMMITGTEGVRDEVMTRVCSFRKPVAVLDEIAGWEPPPSLRTSGHLRIFRNTVSESAGEQAARFLLGLGHTSIAYLSPLHSYAWSIKRFMGLARTYATAGHDAGVKLFTGQAGLYADLHELVLSRSGLQELTHSIQQWLSTKPAGYDFGFEPVIRELEVRCMESEICAAMTPLFDQALADPSITAWVASGDTIARMALQHLSRRKVAVPEALSLFSFDNRLHSLFGHITTYDFNTSAIVDAMLDFVVHLGSTGSSRRYQVQEIEGFIVERKTTGPARKAGHTNGLLDARR